MHTLTQALSFSVATLQFHLEKPTLNCSPWAFKLSQRVFHNPHSQKSLGHVLSNEGNLSLLKSRLKELYPYIPPTIEKVRRVATEIFPGIADQITKVRDPFLRNLCSFQLKILTYSDQNLTPEQLVYLKTKLKEKGGYGLTKEKPISLRALFEIIENELYVFMERPDVCRANKNWKIVTSKDPSKKLTASNLSGAIQSVDSSCTTVREELYQKFGIDLGLSYLQRYAKKHNLTIKGRSTLKAKKIDTQYKEALMEHYKGKEPTSIQVQEFIERTYKKGTPSLGYTASLATRIMFPNLYPGLN